MSTTFSKAMFESLPVVGILRGFSLAEVVEIANASIRGGLQNIEITMNTADAVTQIRKVVEVAGGRMNVGAGTVTNLDLLDEAIAGGATFIVTPTFQRNVVSACVSAHIPVFPGAFSPTEILQAWDAGATAVKVFPADKAGPGYIRAIKAPLPHVKLMPTGGVDLNTLSAFRAAGASAFGVGTPLFDRKRIEAQDWQWVEAQCRGFAQAFAQL